MKFTVQIALSEPMYEELRQAARDASAKGDATDPVCTPEQFAAECVESILASRRLERLPGTPHTGPVVGAFQAALRRAQIEAESCHC